MAVWLDVNPRSGVPIYVQIVEQVKHAIEVGAVQPGEQLPTVRQLATDLTIAPNTIVKAYNELQMLGLIESRPGTGTVVANLNGSIRKHQLDTIFSRLHDIVRDASSLDISEDELASRFDAAVRHFYHQRVKE